MQSGKGAENVRTCEQSSGEISINNLKIENKWKFPGFAGSSEHMRIIRLMLCCL